MGRSLTTSSGTTLAPMRALVAAIAATLALLAPAAVAAAPLTGSDGAIGRAAAIPEVREQLNGSVTANAARDPQGNWLVVFSAGGQTRAVVELRGSDGAKLAVYTGLQAQYPLAR